MAATAGRAGDQRHERAEADAGSIREASEGGGRGSRPESTGPGAFSRALLPVGALVVFAAGFHSLIDPDIWFHLAAGRWILEHGIPRTDPFSFPSAGQPYIDLHWLFQVLVRFVHGLGGEGALVLLACSAVLLAYFLVYRVTRRFAPPPMAAALVALGAILSSERMSPRPEVLSFVFLALTVWLIHRHREGGRHAVWLLPLVFLFWVNTEGLFVLGYLALGAGLLSSRAAVRDRRLWVAAALCVVAALFNPYLLEGALHPFVLYTRINRSLPIYSQTIGEFRGPFQDEALHPAAAVFPWYLGLIGVALLAGGRWPRLGELLAMGALTYLALSARRNMALLPLLATPVVARWLVQGELTGLLRRRWWCHRSAGWRRRVTQGASAIVLLLLLIYLHGLVTNRIYARAETNRRFGPGRAPVAFAREAARFIQENQVRGPIFSTFAAGSYFIWSVPEEKVFIDGRLEVHSAQHYERYLRLRSGGPAWAQADREYGFNAAVIQHLEAMDLMLELLRDRRWAPVHLDDTAIILLKRNERNESLIERFSLDLPRLRETYPTRTAAQMEEGLTLPAVPGVLARVLTRVRVPWSRLHLGQFFLGLNRPEFAVPQFLEAVNEAPGVSAPRIMLAMALNGLGRPALALPVLESAQRLGGSRLARARAWIVRGDLQTALDQPESAITSYDRSLALLSRKEDIPQVGSLLSSRAYAKLRAGDTDGAAADIQESLLLLPNHRQGWLYLGMIEEARGRPEAARRAYERVAAMGGATGEVEEALRRLGDAGRGAIR